MPKWNVFYAANRNDISLCLDQEHVPDSGGLSAWRGAATVW